MASGIILICGLFALGGCGLTGNGNSLGNAAQGTITPIATGRFGSTPSATATGTGTSGSSSAVLSCNLSTHNVNPTLEQITVSCSVNDAPSDQTSFTATYRIASSMAQSSGRSCTGSLKAGAGSCSLSFDEDAVYANPGTVTGVLLPSHDSLGPVTPKRVS
jgi:hypothetical protein